MELAYRKTAREYYTDPPLGNLLTAVFKKYQGQNGVRGNAKIRVTSGAESERLQNYFGNRLSRLIQPGTVVEVPLKVFAEELQLGDNLSIPDLYEVLYNQPLLTKLEQRQLKEEAWNRLFEQVSRQLKQDAGFDLNDTNFRNESFNWLERLQAGQVPGYRVLKNALNKGEKADEALFHCMKGLWHLLVGMEAMLKELNISVNKVRIPVFATFVTKDKDPHGFDWKESAGRLLWYALYDIDQQRVRAAQESTSENMIVPEYMQKRQIYRNFGLMDDDLSSFSHVFAPYFVSGTSPRTLNLGEIQTYGKFPAYSALYAFENPAVFSHIVDELVFFLDRSGLSLEQIPGKFPALVCASGQPRSAALAFITECLKANPSCPVRYSGDMDLPGVQMMWGMQKQFTVNFEALRMDVKDYRNHSDLPHLLLSFQDKKVLEKERDNLAKVMVELGIKVYQEELVQDLTEDVLEVIRQEVEKG
ncbi:TIGR02679 domain-containing protein [Desulfosporosinus fructosivorans]